MYVVWFVICIIAIRDKNDGKFVDIRNAAYHYHGFFLEFPPPYVVICSSLLFSIVKACVCLKFWRQFTIILLTVIFVFISLDFSAIASWLADNKFEWRHYPLLYTGFHFTFVDNETKNCLQNYCIRIHTMCAKELNKAKKIRRYSISCAYGFVEIEWVKCYYDEHIYLCPHMKLGVL